MKSLIKPFIVASFLLTLSGLVPGVSIIMAGIGFISMLLWVMAGVHLLGSQDQEYEAQLELIRLEYLRAQELANKSEKKFAVLEEQVSRAIANMKSERRLG